MNKDGKVKKLKLKKETLRRLSDDKLQQVAGGAGNCCAYGGTAIRSASAVVEAPDLPSPAPSPIPGQTVINIDGTVNA
ncbi:MAG: class I lanthipeptide [Myxococcota bacterium]